jgi:hypothetical protein
MGERLAGSQKVVGSNPTCSIPLRGRLAFDQAVTRGNQAPIVLAAARNPSKVKGSVRIRVGALPLKRDRFKRRAIAQETTGLAALRG